MTFSDGTVCDVKLSTGTAAICVTEAFTNPDSPGLSINIAVDTVAGGQVTTEFTGNRRLLQSGTFSASAPTDVAESVSPNSVNPVIKNDLTIQLSSGFPTITDTDDYIVTVKGVTDSTYSKRLNIVEYKEAEEQLIVRFNGAPSGDYLIDIAGPQGVGVITGSGLPLTTLIRLDSFSPAGGSTLGGTLVTLTGQHFGNVATDNPVKIGDNFCYVQETSEFEIKCRIRVDEPQVEATAEIVVFAKASEEMVCNIGVGGDECVFNYAAPTADVTDIVESFDASSNKI